MSYSVKHSSASLLGKIHIGGHNPKSSCHVSHKVTLSISPHKSHSVHGGSGSKIPFFKYLPNSSHYNTGSVYGDYNQGSSFGGHNGWKNNGLLSTNEKETMQSLNDRLSTYLGKVSALEQENAQLERKICEWYENNATISLPDYCKFLRTIEDLQNEVFSTTMDNARIVLQIDNAKLAAEDFKSKFEIELGVRNNVEEDVRGLRRALDELNMERRDLEMQMQCLQEELEQLKKNHEEEVNSLRAQLGARVNVELNAAPSVDLNRALVEIREQYENLMERNMKEAEALFQQRSAELNREMSSGAEQLKSINNELIDLRRTAQTLEIELQSQLSMKSSLECSLEETQANYASQLAQLQGLIDNVEAQLAQIRSDLERQNQEYRLLMDQKTHLEMEIATYKRLLEGHDINVQAHHSSGGTHGSQHNK
ncbi:keratin, type I cytoskeletal 19-like [Bombina bombina]|uniref:keratin, type I cytoskeletal 19-like n=1 Tax=Bombina bombina TaxID=8345 RepID=UPI00235AAC88|nr:keratin, type I cytoskeletal 19-like [Bombina bombina]